MKARSLSFKSAVLALSMVSLPSGALAEEIWVAPSFPGAINSTSFVWPVTGGGFSFFTFGVPDDMESFVSARIVLLPESTSAAAETYQLFIEVKRDGETVAAADWSIDSDSAATVDNTLQEVDISTQLGPELNATSPGNDIVSMFFWFPGPGTADTDGRVVGMRFAYTELPDANTVDSSTVVDESLTQADLAPNSVGIAELAPNSIISADIIDGAIISVDVFDGSIGGIDIQSETLGAGHIQNGAVASSEILDNSITSSDIQDSTIADFDILNEAGADFASGDQFVHLTRSPVIVRSVTISAPSAGRVILNASGYFDSFPLRSASPDARSPRATSSISVT